jgi:hypothetical protein
MNRLALTFITLAATSLTLSGTAFSQNEQLMAGTATLDHQLDTRSATAGQIITAKLSQEIVTPGGVKLPRGTELVGHIDQAQASKGKSSAEIDLTFDKAQLKDGKSLPIKATLVQISEAYSVEAPQTVVTADAVYDQKDVLPGIDLYSKVQADNSGKLVSKNKNFHLLPDTELLVAIAPQAQ